MYSIKEDVFKSMLKKKFNGFIGTTCECIENLFKEDISKKTLENIVKEILKKNAYNTMRDIDDSVSAFNKGINININFERPNSK